MCARWVWFATLVAAAAALQLTDEQYYQMPQLFDMDDYDACVSRRGGEYCLGTFQLSADDNKLFDVMKSEDYDYDACVSRRGGEYCLGAFQLSADDNKLFDIMKEYSKNDFNFNHTLLHRGYCVMTRCAHIDEPSAERRFEKCVTEWTEENYGLKAKLSKLNYCKTGERMKRPIDELDMTVAYLVGALVLMNLVGTAYELMRNPDNKPNKYIISWSLISSWRKLAAKYEDQDPRLLSFGPLHGIKSISLIMVMLAHSISAINLSYVRNVLFFERANVHPLSILVYNGTATAQTYILVASFLFVYNKLLQVEKDPKYQICFHKIPQYLGQRIIRIVPTYMFVIGITVTWWEYVGDGGMWTPIVEQERANCRDKWWAQLLFVNNFVKTDKHCLVQTWYLAADMQLYVLVTFLTVIFFRWPGAAVKSLTVMFISAVILNFFIYYHWNLKSFLFFVRPETLRMHMVGLPSLDWNYMAPWSSLPSSLLGILFAFIYHRLQKAEFKAIECRCIRIAYRLSIPLLFAWVLCGNWIKDLKDPLHTAIYATVERPVFITIVTIFLFGAFSKIDSVCWRFLSWRGWQVISRMSFSIYMIHYHYNLSQAAAVTTAITASGATLGGHFLVTVFMSVLTALPLYLFVEAPAQKFLQTLIE